MMMVGLSPRPATTYVPYHVSSRAGFPPCSSSAPGGCPPPALGRARRMRRTHAVPLPALLLASSRARAVLRGTTPAPPACHTEIRHDCSNRAMQGSACAPPADNLPRPPPRLCLVPLRRCPPRLCWPAQCHLAHMDGRLHHGPRRALSGPNAPTCPVQPQTSAVGPPRFLLLTMLFIHPLMSTPLLTI